MKSTTHRVTRFVPAIVMAGGILWFLYCAVDLLFLPDPRKRHAEELGRFVEIGRRIKSELDRKTSPVATDVDELLALGVISHDDCKFLREKRITYYPPIEGAPGDWVILAWPQEEGRPYGFFLDGDCDVISRSRSPTTYSPVPLTRP